MSRRAKIVCTLGPATASPERVRALVDAGMDVARLNLSHGTADEHRALLAHVRRAAADTGRAVGVLADLPGPKIRLDRFRGGRATIEKGAEFTISTQTIEGDASRASTSYRALATDVGPGDPILIDDGQLALEVIETDGKTVRTRVVRGGMVSDHKGINLPGVAISAPALDARNQELLRFALDLGADLVAMSFVRSPEDAASARQILDELRKDVPIIAKIEKPEAVDHLETIITAFDGIMVARGDLGVEMPLENVPLTQKRAIQLAREQAKPAIVATQMLESMIAAPRPTRAEVSDVANAVFDGADALMLSGETSIGAYPIETLATMARIIEAAEADGLDRLPALKTEPTNTPDAIARAGPRVARDVGAIALVSFTTSGTTVRRLASHRDRTPLIAFTGEEVVRHQLALVWGVETFVVPFVGTTDQMVALVEESLTRLGRVKVADRIVIVAGSPPGRRGTTNMIRVRRVGHP